MNWENFYFILFFTPTSIYTNMTWIHVLQKLQLLFDLKRIHNIIYYAYYKNNIYISMFISENSQLNELIARRLLYFSKI